MSGGKTVTSQRIEATQRSRVTIFCKGGRNRNWKKGTGSTATNLPAGVVQIKNNNGALLLIIESLTPANTGVYACHIGGSTIETVTVGEFT